MFSSPDILFEYKYKWKNKSHETVETSSDPAIACSQSSRITSTFVPRLRHPVLAPSSCDRRDGKLVSTFAMNIGSVRGVKSSGLGSRWLQGIRQTQPRQVGKRQLPVSLDCMVLPNHQFHERSMVVELRTHDRFACRVSERVRCRHGV
jgi:hypothetical protein